MKGILITIVSTVLLLSASIGMATERHAIVIGNSDYKTAPLKNPRNDALDMAEELSNLGYKIHRGKALLDLNLGEFENEIYEFALSLPKNAVAVVYYAGHGIATNADNYLIPRDANLLYEEQLKTRAVSLRDTVALLNERNRDGLNVFFLDACRDSPLESQYGRSMNRGLSRIGDLAKGSFIGYAADKGQIAIDGQGRNGVYTGELLRALRNEPSMPIQLLHNRVAQRVYEKTSGTNNPQLPVSEQKFIGEYCVGDCDNEILGQKLALGSDPQPLPHQPSSDSALSTDGQATEKKFTRKHAYIAIGAALLLGALAAGSSGGSDGGESGSSTTFTLNIPQLP